MRKGKVSRATMTLTPLLLVALAGMQWSLTTGSIRWRSISAAIAVCVAWALLWSALRDLSRANQRQP